MKSSTKNVAKSARDAAYYRQRHENRVFAKLVAWISEECQRLHITQKEFAERMGKDPGLVSRLLSHPSNLTLDTICDLLLALDAEAEPPEIVRFADRAAPNYMHPLIARVTGATSIGPGKADTASRERTISLSPKIEVATASSAAA
jgi:transcriptional regulator with XRE-family HTH domain